MKLKQQSMIMLLLSAFVISGCQQNKPSNQPSSEEKVSSSINEPSSETLSSTPVSSENKLSSQTPSSENKPSSAPKSESQPASSATPRESSAPASSLEPSSAPISSKPASSKQPSSEPEAPTYLKKDIEVSLEPGLKKGENLEPYALSFYYDDECFLDSAKCYSNNLSMLSYASSIATSSKEQIVSFFTDVEFDNIAPSASYDIEPTKDTIGYCFAHRHIDDFDVVGLSIRGFNYGMEWANNFLIGKTGNHEGFMLRGQEVYEALQTYLAKLNITNLKLWINGYSRGGAISNVVASLIMEDETFEISEDNLYVYTFEAPTALTLEHAAEYENVHNITNEADLITFIPPESYDLRRCGVDFNIYDSGVKELMMEFDPEIEFPVFAEMTASEVLRTNDVEVREYVVNSIFNSDIPEDNVAARTREQYVDNYQEHLSVMIGYIFALKPATRTALLNNLTDMSVAISIMFDSTGKALADLLKPYLEQDNVAYDEETLEAHCAVLIDAVINLFPSVLSMYMQEDQKGDLMRLIDMHYPETTYVLLTHAHTNELVE